MNETLHQACNLINPKYKHVLEFGVYKGKTIRQLRDTLPLDFKLFGFDSFIGLPEDWTGTDIKKSTFNLNGNIPNVENVTFYKGWFKDTIPEYIMIAEPIALLHIDCDLYSSTIEILYNLNSYIKRGTVIAFDEWVYNHQDLEKNRQHEQKAFNEWVNEFDIKFELIPRSTDYVEMERQIVIIK